MNRKNKNSGTRKVLVTMIYYLSVILAALLLGVTNQIAGWVVQIVVALSLFRLAYVLTWGAAKNGWGWRI